MLEHVVRALNGKLVTVQKVDNGFIATLVEMPEGAQITEQEKEARIDRLLHAMPAVIERLHPNKEKWESPVEGKRPPSQKAVREAFEAMYPEVVRVGCSEPQPHIELKVFPTIEELFEYLKSTLS